MEIIYSGQNNVASNVTAIPVRRLPDTVCCVGDNFFAHLARTLLGKDAGYQLHLLTGFPERNCYRYASGESPVPGFFLRKLLHSEGGHVWLAALMAGSQTSWWKDHQRGQNIQIE